MREDSMFDQDELNQLYQYAYSLSRHTEDSYDLLYSVIEKCLKNKIQPLSKAYVRTMIRNQYIDQWRRKQIIEFESVENFDTTLAIETNALDSLVLQEKQIEKIWDHLDLQERDILFLWAVEGYTAQEISNELGKPRSTILSMIYRLRKKIVKLLADHDLLEGSGGSQC